MKTEKKLKARELEKKTKAFLYLGLLLTSSLALLAFSWKTPINQTVSNIAAERIAEVPIIEIIEEKEKPIVQKVEKPMPKQVVAPPKNDVLVDDYKEKESSKTTEPVISVSPPVIIVGPPVPPPTIDFLVEYPNQEAMFDGSWVHFLSSNLSYPEESRIFNEEGTIYLSFVVDKNGEISNVEVLPGSAKSKPLQKEALRVLKSSPKWKPAIHEGEKVKSLKKVRINPKNSFKSL